ncbi:nicotinate-nucleotide diphosphorylase [Streptomyces sp. NPDC059651]|uniref:nicotinate-nucleotide diphosphorylase n=1 Tax=Streptomyces sp. NPDC059651 TaxID=3346897 RepID=UPI00367606B8
MPQPQRNSLRPSFPHSRNSDRDHGVTTAVDSVRENMASEGRAVAIEVEVATIAQVREALQAEPSWIMLANMTVPQLAEAVRLRRELVPTSEIRLDASGTITLDDLRAVAETAVDAISVGSLTHSPPAMDPSMLLSID